MKFQHNISLVTYKRKKRRSKISKDKIGF